MNKKNDCGSAMAALLLILVGIVLLFTAAGKLATDKAKQVTDKNAGRTDNVNNDVTITDLGPNAEPDVVKEALRARRKKENSEWTPANIRKHPDLYLDHCETMLESLMEECKDALFAARLESVQQGRKVESSREDIATSREFLIEAEAIAAREDQSFPVKIGPYIYSAAMFTNAIHEADTIATKGEQAIPIHENAKARADNLAIFLEATISNISTELEGLSINREALRADSAQKAVEDVKKRIDNLMDGVIITKPALPPGRKALTKDEGIDVIFKRNREKAFSNNK